MTAPQALPIPLSLRRAFAALVLAAASAASVAAPAVPAAVQALQMKGVTIAGIPAPGGLGARAGYAGHNPMGERVWQQLASSRWVQDGKSDAPRIVYVFTDPNCPYCNKFWADARPWVDSGKVVLRHVIVGILTPTSPGKAAALLSGRNPAAAFAAYERDNAERNRRDLARGHPHPLADGGLEPLATIPPAIEAQLAANEKLMAFLGLQATPAMAWRDASGALQVHTGAPDSVLPVVLGPR